RARQARRADVHAPLDGLRHAPSDPEGRLHGGEAPARGSQIDAEAGDRGSPRGEAGGRMTGAVVWLVGATGLVGRETLAALLERDEVTRVVAFVRRPTGVSHPRLEERVVDF